MLANTYIPSHLCCITDCGVERIILCFGNEVSRFYLLYQLPNPPEPQQIQLQKRNIEVKDQHLPHPK